MKKIFIVLVLVAVFFTSCEGYRTVSHRPSYYYRPVPTVQYVYPRPQYYYYPQPYYNMPRHYSGGRRR